MAALVRKVPAAAFVAVSAGVAGQVAWLPGDMVAIGRRGHARVRPDWRRQALALQEDAAFARAHTRAFCVWPARCRQAVLRAGVPGAGLVVRLAVHVAEQHLPGWEGRDVIPVRAANGRENRATSRDGCRQQPPRLGATPSESDILLRHCYESLLTSPRSLAACRNPKRRSPCCSRRTRKPRHPGRLHTPCSPCRRRQSCPPATCTW